MFELISRVPSRYYLAYGSKGNFFICGLGEEDFAELPQDLIWKFRERFWVPEAFVSMFGQMAVIQMDDGTKPE